MRQFIFYLTGKTCCRCDCCVFIAYISLSFLSKMTFLGNSAAKVNMILSNTEISWRDTAGKIRINVFLHEYMNT